MKEGGKRIRDDKDVVTNRLYEIFEKHQYYNIQDLVKLTNQPVVSLGFCLFLCFPNVDILVHSQFGGRIQYVLH